MAEASSAESEFTGVGPTPERLRIDAGALEAYLRGQIAGFTGPVTVEKFKGGQSNPTYLLTTPKRRYVLRRKPPGALLPSAHAIEREYRVMSALHAVGFPAPQNFALCENPDVIGTAFFVMDFVDGRIFWDSGLPDVARPERAPLYHALIDTLAALHSIDPAKAGLSDFGKAGNYFARQIDRWGKQYAAAETEKIEEMDRLAAWLPTAIPTDDASSIVHGDFRFDNVIVDHERPVVRAVLDWELSTIGHPLADFTYFLMVWRFPSSVRGGLADKDLVELGIPALEDAARRYAEKSGRAALDHLDFCFAYNMFRLAAIAQGVYARALQGNASSEHARKMGAQIRPLAALAWDHARKAGA